MRYLFDHSHTIGKRLGKGRLFLFLDFDGTLAPIVNKPGKVSLSAEGRKLLKELSARSSVKLAIISGRALRDVKNKIGLRSIIYSGNHGYEIEGPTLRYKYPLPLEYPELKGKIKADLEKMALIFPGAFVEDKGICVSLHYRFLDKDRAVKIKAMFKKIVSPYLKRGDIRIKAGKMVREVVPPCAWDKARAVRWLLARANAGAGNGAYYPVYIGDDSSDEGAFKALKNKGLTVYVGSKKQSHAGYYVRDPGETRDFLRKLAGGVYV